MPETRRAFLAALAAVPVALVVPAVAPKAAPLTFHRDAFALTMGSVGGFKNFGAGGRVVALHGQENVIPLRLVKCWREPIEAAPVDGVQQFIAGPLHVVGVEDGGARGYA